MSNLNLSGFSDPLYGNQYYRSIAAHGVKSAFEPGSIDATKLAKANSFEECLSVNIDLSKHYDKTDTCSDVYPLYSKYNKCQPIHGAGIAGEYIKLTPLPVMDPHCLVTALTFDGNNSIDSEVFEVELGVLYGSPDPFLLDPVPCTGTVEYVSLAGDFEPAVAGPKQKAGEVVSQPNMNVGQVQLVPEGASILPMCYNQGNLGTPVLKILTSQNDHCWPGKVNVKLKWVNPN